MQDRIGPNRVGPWGLLQPLADGGKIFLKEEVIPAHVDKVFYLLAPAVGVRAPALLALAVVPFGSTTSRRPPPQATLAAFDTAQQAVSRAASRFSRRPGPRHRHPVYVRHRLAGGVRRDPRRVECEQQVLAARLAAVVGPDHQLRNPARHEHRRRAALRRSLNLETIIAWQAGTDWHVFFQPLAFLLFFTAACTPSATACRSTCRKPSRNSSAATTPSIRR